MTETCQRTASGNSSKIRDAASLADVLGWEMRSAPQLWLGRVTTGRLLSGSRSKHGNGMGCVRCRAISEVARSGDEFCRQLLMILRCSAKVLNAVSFLQQRDVPRCKISVFASGNEPATNFTQRVWKACNSSSFNVLVFRSAPRKLDHFGTSIASH